MIPLKPIHKSIRKELHLRERALVGNVNSRITEPKDPDGFTALQYMSKVPWVRMISPVNSTVIVKKTPGATKDDKPIISYPPNNTGIGGLKYPVIGGGLLSSDGKIKSKFDDLYNTTLFDIKPGTLDIQDKKIDFPSRLKNRPIPGIENVNVSYEGGFKAIRTVEIKWVCHTLEDLDALLPHFLTAGRSVILEYGWQFAGRNGIITPLFLSTFFEDNTLTLENLEKVSNPAKYIHNSNGNSELVMGIIKSFDINTRDDGGFDCTTSLVSEGVDMFGREFQTSDNLKDTSFDEVIEDDMLLSGLSFSEFIEHFGDIMIEKLKSKTLSQEGLSVTTKGAMQIFRSRAFNAYLYVSLGWFEDNVISKFLGTTVKDGALSLTEMRSYDEFDEFHEPAEGAQGPAGFSVFRRSVKITNHKHLYSPDLFKFILPGQIFPPGYTRPTGTGGFALLTGADPDASFIASINRIERDVKRGGSPKFAIDENRKFGYVRNILLNWKTIQDAFTNAENLTAGFDELFRILDEGLGIWDLTLTLDTEGTGGAKNRLKIIDKNTVFDAQDDDFFKTSEYKDDKVTGRIYEFKTWTKDSIVRSQNFNITLPDKFAIAAMYGNNDIDGSSLEDIGQTKALNLSAMDVPKEGSDPENVKYYQDDQAKTNLKSPKFIPDYGNMSANLENELVTATDSPRELYEGTTIEISAKIATSKKEVTYAGIWNRWFGDSEEVIAAEEKIEEIEEKKRNLSEFTQHGDNKILNDFYLITKDSILMNPIYKEAMNKVLKFRTGDDDQKRMLLVPFKLELEIDGIAGIVPGNSFTSYYIPKRYKNKKDGIIFQVMNVEHDISSGDWITKIEGIMSYKRIPLVLLKDSPNTVVKLLLDQIEKELGVANTELIKSQKEEADQPGGDPDTAWRIFKHIVKTKIGL